MDGAAALITAIGGLVTALTGLVGVIFIGIRGSRRERHHAADITVTKVLENLTPPEPADIAEKLGEPDD